MPEDGRAFTTFASRATARLTTQPQGSRPNPPMESPFQSMDSAILALDEICRTVAILPGTLQLELSWTDGDLHINGMGQDPSEVILETIGEGTKLFEVGDGATLFGASGGAAEAAGFSFQEFCERLLLIANDRID